MLLRFHCLLVWSLEEEIFANLDDLYVLCCIYIILLLLSVGVVSTMVADTPHKIFVGCLPNYLNEDEVGRALVRRCMEIVKVSLSLQKFISVLIVNFIFIAFSVSLFSTLRYLFVFNCSWAGGAWLVIICKWNCEQKRYAGLWYLILVPCSLVQYWFPVLSIRCSYVWLSYVICEFSYRFLGFCYSIFD